MIPFLVALYNKLTPAWQLLLKAFGAMLLAALVGAGQATYQRYTQGGFVNLNDAVPYATATFFSAFGVSLYLYVPSHVQIEMQALQDMIAARDTQIDAHQDTITTLRARNSMLTQQVINPVATSVSQPQQTPVQVHVYNSLPPVVSSSSVPPTSPTTPPVSSDPTVAQSPFENVSALATSYKPVSLVSVPVEHPPVSDTIVSTPVPLQGAFTSSGTVVSEISMDTLPRAIAHLQKQ